MSDFECPKCNENLNIIEMELWEAYEEDGKETEIDCPECGTTIRIISEIVDWNFEAELIE